MEKQGLVERLEDPQRKGGVKVTLTKKGEEALLGATKVRESISVMSSALSAEERENLKLSLAKMRSAALDKLGLKDRPLSPSRK